MYYKKIKEMTLYKLNPELINKFDLWLASLPMDMQDSITLSQLSKRLEIDLNLAKSILNNACDLNILNEKFLVLCPKCGSPIKKCAENELYDVLVEIDCCPKCNEKCNAISPENIMVVYEKYRNINFVRNKDIENRNSNSYKKGYVKILY